MSITEEEDVGLLKITLSVLLHGAVRHSQCNAVRKEARVKKPKHVSRKRPTYPVCGLCFELSIHHPLVQCVSVPNSTAVVNQDMG